MQHIIQKAREGLEIYDKNQQRLAEARETRDRLSKPSAKAVSQAMIRELAEAKSAVDLLEGREANLDSVVVPIVEECNALIQREVEALKATHRKVKIAALRAAADSLITKIEADISPDHSEYDLRHSPLYRAEDATQFALGVFAGAYVPEHYTREDVKRALNTVIHVATNLATLKASVDRRAIEYGLAA